MSGEKKTRNRLKQHSKLLPNKTGNLSRALRKMPGAARRRYAVFQLISSGRKNDAVIATAICSEHKSRARLLRRRVDIDIYTLSRKTDISAFLYFYSLFFSRLAARSEFELGSNYCYYFVVNEGGGEKGGRFLSARTAGYILSALVLSFLAAKRRTLFQTLSSHFSSTLT